MTASPCPFLFPGVRYRQVERSRQRHSAKHALNWSRCRRRFAVAETNDGGALTRGLHERDVDSTRADESLANTGSLTSRGRFNASPNAVWRALTEYDSLHRVSEPVVTCKRLWISSRVGRAVLRLQSVDHEPLWGSMDGNFEVRIEEDRENGRITFESERADDKYGFAVKGCESVSLPHCLCHILFLFSLSNDLTLHIEIEIARLLVPSAGNGRCAR